MSRSILLAAAASLAVTLGACNKRDETIVNDPMAANDVVDLPAGESPATEEPANLAGDNAGAETNAAGNASAANSVSAAEPAAGAGNTSDHNSH